MLRVELQHLPVNSMILDELVGMIIFTQNSFISISLSLPYLIYQTSCVEQSVLSVITEIVKYVGFPQYNPYLFFIGNYILYGGE